MRVTMKVAITGTRNGDDWPPVGGTVDVPQDEAEHLVAAGLAVRAAAAPQVEAATVDAPETAATPKARARRTTTPKS